MRKKYGLYQPITEQTFNQLLAAGIEVDTETEIETIQLTDSQRIPSYMRTYMTYLYTRSEKQETLLALLFPADVYTLVEEIEYERDHY
jgi:hypothetical protein